MILAKSIFVHLVPVGEGRWLLMHALRNHRLAIDAEVASVIQYFAQPRDLDNDLGPLRAAFGDDTLQIFLAQLVERGILTNRDGPEELADAGREISAFHGRDPESMLERYRRKHAQGTEPGWAVASAYGIRDLGTVKPRLDVILFGDCELQMAADFLRRAMAERGVELTVAATFPDDTGLAGERTHDAIVIGALRSRRAVMAGNPGHYVEEAARMIEALRVQSKAPILLDGLPEPTVQPMGIADRGPDGHRNLFRRVNLGLTELAAQFSDVYIVDVAAALAAKGANRLLDDGLVGFDHFGSPGWMLQRPESERAAVHTIFPDLDQLADFLGGDPYGRESCMAQLHADALTVVLGLDQRKCVIVDLDGTLWPGVLAETGAPFAWTPEISGPFSFVGLYFGIQEALKTLQKRGIVLACVSKNDEATVRELWKYESHYPLDRLLTLDSFVTCRINWDDKVENIRSIAEELGFGLERFLFVDDNPLERERVRLRIPEVAILGDNLFALRRQLLEDPRLQVPHITQESRQRTDLVKAQLSRAKIRQAASSEAAFLASLDVVCEIEQPDQTAALERVRELFERTTQFNTTGQKFSLSELESDAKNGGAYAMRVRDRFGDHGLVAAAILRNGEIVAFAMSCRVIGLGAEFRLLERMIDDAANRGVKSITARIIETARNIPVRNLYRDAGFVQGMDGFWKIEAISVAQKSHTKAE